jgi:hypothetical protein
MGTSEQLAGSTELANRPRRANSFRFFGFRSYHRKPSPILLSGFQGVRQPLARVGDGFAHHATGNHAAGPWKSVDYAGT